MIRQSCHFERDFYSVLLQLADSLNTQFNTERAADFPRGLLCGAPDAFVVSHYATLTYLLTYFTSFVHSVIMVMIII